VFIALDVAVLPPPDVSRRAIELSAALPRAEFQGLRLGPEMLPHITLTQQFVEAANLDRALDAVSTVLQACRPVTLSITGGGKGRSSVWMTIEAPPLVDLHTRLMQALGPFERSEGSAAAFHQGDARPGDVAWVAGYRRDSSFTAYTPHITLGHASVPPTVPPATFDATTIAACHLGRFCSCRRILRTWNLEP